MTLQRQVPGGALTPLTSDQILALKTALGLDQVTNSPGGGGGGGAAFDPTSLQQAIALKADAASLTKAGVGLPNVDNTADASKPVSTLQAAAILAAITALTKVNVGLGSVDNTADAAKPVSTLQAAAITAAIGALTKASVGLTLVDNTPDMSKPVSTLQATAIATAVANLVNSAPASLDTLKEFATALGNDANFSVTIMGLLAAKADAAATAAALASKVSELPTVTLTGATTLYRDLHLGHQLIYNGPAANLTIATDAAATAAGHTPWAAGDAIDVVVQGTSAGIPTLVSSDATPKTIVGSLTQGNIGGTCWAANSWNLGSTAAVASAGNGGASTTGGTQVGSVISPAAGLTGGTFQRGGATIPTAVASPPTYATTSLDRGQTVNYGAAGTVAPGVVVDATSFIKYAGKIVGVLTDSFGATPFFLFAPIMQKIGATLAINAVPGRCAAHGTDTAEGDGTTRIPAVDALSGFLTANSTMSAIVISVGSNDFHYSVPVGVVSSTDNTTYAGALNVMIAAVKAFNPAIRIVLVTPCVRGDAKKGGGGGGTANIALQQPYADMVKAVAQANSVVVVDQFYNPDMAYANLGANTADTVHPSTALGRARFCSAVANILVVDNYRPTIMSASCPSTTTALIYWNDMLSSMSLAGIQFYQNGLPITATAVVNYTGDAAALPMSAYLFTLPTFASTDKITVAINGAAAVDYAGGNIADTAGQYVVNAGTSAGGTVTAAYSTAALDWTNVSPGAGGTTYNATSHTLSTTRAETGGEGSFTGSAQSAQAIQPFGHTGVEVGRMTVPILTLADAAVFGFARTVPLVGNGASPPIQRYTTIDFAIYNNGTLIKVFELGVLKFTSTGTLSGNNEVHISVSAAGVVTYYLNNTLVYTSATTAVFPLYAAASLNAPNGTIVNATISNWNA